MCASWTEIVVIFLIFFCIKGPRSWVIVGPDTWYIALWVEIWCENMWNCAILRYRENTYKWDQIQFADNFCYTEKMCSSSQGYLHTSEHHKKSISRVQKHSRTTIRDSSMNQNLASQSANIFVIRCKILWQPRTKFFDNHGQKNWHRVQRYFTTMGKRFWC